MSHSSTFVNLAGNCVSLCKRFAITDDSDSNLQAVSKLFPVYPNEALKKINSKFGQLQFVYKKNVSPIPDTHIALKMDELFQSELTAEKETLCIFIEGKTASFGFWKEDEFKLIKVQQFESAEELLYMASLLFEHFHLDKTKDDILFSGSIAEESKIIQTFRIYFKYVAIKKV